MTIFGSTKHHRRSLGVAGLVLTALVGFAPAEAPRVAVIVVLDGQPHDSHFYGGDVSAPVFSSIMGAALRQMHVPTTRDALGPSQARTGPRTAPQPGGPAGAVAAATVSTPTPSKPTK